ncbi:cation:proton antiporter [Streptomyces sp. NPDC001832]|uniref:cation:proton antiporter domain-containing protein n=1 Tax=Streptomyces sp. NPDC001832 TaxID=3154527 RepID=UPI003328E68D
MAGSTSGTQASGGAVVELVIGLVYGTVLGLTAGWLLRSASRRGWATEDVAGAGVLALALLGYTSSVAIGGNGFVAAFMAGLAFGSTHGAPHSACCCSSSSPLRCFPYWCGCSSVPYWYRPPSITSPGRQCSTRC